MNERQKFHRHDDGAPQTEHPQTAAAGRFSDNQRLRVCLCQPVRLGFKWKTPSPLIDPKKPEAIEAFQSYAATSFMPYQIRGALYSLK